MPFLDSLKKEANMLSRDISRGISEVTKTFQAPTSTTQALFSSGNVIQLISRSSGQALQIVQAPTGQLVVDGKGPEGPNFLHAHWTVLNEGNNHVKLYNQNNYLAILNGNTMVMSVANPSLAGAETSFSLLENSSHFLLLESRKERGRYLGVNDDGSLRSAVVADSGNHNHFAAKLIYSPYPQAGAGAIGGTKTVVTTTTYKK